MKTEIRSIVVMMVKTTLIVERTWTNSRPRGGCSRAANRLPILLCSPVAQERERLFLGAWSARLLLEKGT
jgi:hypothetical protein